MKIKVAAIQMASINNHIDINLRNATQHIDAAVKSGAKLVLLSELLSSGYGWTPALWDGAEPKNGKTIKWMCGASKTYGIYLGTTYLEANTQKEDFDLLLLPHSSPTPQKRKHVKQAHIDRFVNDVKVAAERYSALLGIPVVLSNKCGKFESPAPMGPYEKATFPGSSTITDSNGMVVA